MSFFPRVSLISMVSMVSNHLTGVLPSLHEQACIKNSNRPARVTFSLPATNNANVSIITQPSRASIPSLQQHVHLRSPKPKREDKCPPIWEARNLFLNQGNHPTVSALLTVLFALLSQQQMSMAELAGQITRDNLEYPTTKYQEHICNQMTIALSRCRNTGLAAAILFLSLTCRSSLRNRRSFHWFSCTANLVLRSFEAVGTSSDPICRFLDFDINCKVSPSPFTEACEVRLSSLQALAARLLLIYQELYTAPAPISATTALVFEHLRHGLWYGHCLAATLLVMHKWLDMLVFFSHYI